MQGDAVIDQMLAAGLEMPAMPLDLSGKARRFGPKKAHWYRLRELRTDGGTWVVVGTFGNHKGQQRWRVEVDWAGIGEAERAQLQATREAQRKAEAEQRARESARAAMTAAELWREGSPIGRSEYLDRKGVQAEACRYLPDGSLLVPLLRYDLPREEALRAVQRIWPDGTKRFTRGFEKARCSVRLGMAAVGDPVLVCEGYATGLSLRMAVERRYATYVALDAGNLGHVVALVRELHPGSLVVICADDDWRTAGNPGKKKAWEAAKAVPNCLVTYPIFRPGLRGEKDTDFNDLHAREGLAMVRRQLRLASPRLAPAAASSEGAARAA